MARRKVVHRGEIDWGSWVKSFGVWLVGVVVLMVGFYFTTKSTLEQHNEKFIEIGKQFEKFNDTLKQNYSEWAKANKTEQEKADKIREQFMVTFSEFGKSTAAMKVQVDTVSKQLDSVTNKLDAIQDGQRQNRRNRD